MQLRSSQKPTRRPPQLRHRRVGGGYRPDDVEETLGGVPLPVARANGTRAPVRRAPALRDTRRAGCRSVLGARRRDRVRRPRRDGGEARPRPEAALMAATEDKRGLDATSEWRRELYEAAPER